MTKEALKLALEALEAAYARLVTKCEQNLVTYNGVDVDTLTLSQEAITAIKEALAQPEQDGKCKYCTDGCPACDARKLPEQEPVAWRHKQFFETQEGWFYADWHSDGINPPSAELLYTTPPQRKPLTDEETYKIQTSVGYSGGFSRFVGIVRAIEAAHGIKGEA